MNKEAAIAEIKKAYKPSVFLPVYISIVCIAPYIHLLLEITNQNYEKLLFLALISGPLIFITSYVWIRFFHKKALCKNEIVTYLKNSEMYKW